MLRAFDVETGAELWRAELPAGGQATPMTYRLEATGRQYVVIAAGGHGGLDTTRGDHVIAFAAATLSRARRCAHRILAKTRAHPYIGDVGESRLWR